MHTHTQTHTQTQVQTDEYTDTDTFRHTHTLRHTHPLIHRHININGPKGHQSRGALVTTNPHAANNHINKQASKRV
jgi:hypothetical protein